MGRRRYNYRNSRGELAAIEHVRAYRALTQRLGPVVPKIKEAFLQLDAQKLERLLSDYEQAHGAKAASYAREAYPRWKAGTTKMSGQTAERMINLVPKYLETSQRFELVKSLCLHHRRKVYRHVVLEPKAMSACIDQIKSFLKELQNAATQEHFPDHVFESIVWLNDADAVIARKMMNDAKILQTAQVLQAIKVQWPKIVEIIERRDVKNFSESFEFPNGTLTIATKRKSTCFIATAAYGTPDHPDVMLLRDYRDKQLRSHWLGQLLIFCYERTSPWIAQRIVTAPRIGRAVRAILEATAVKYVRERHGKG